MSNSLNRNFVLLSDITGGIQEMNYVIYNPSKIKFDNGAKFIHRQVMEYYHIDLPIAAIYELTEYSVQDLDQFIERFRDMIHYYRKYNKIT